MSRRRSELVRAFLDVLFPEGGCALCGSWLPVSVCGRPWSVEVCPACLQAIFASPYRCQTDGCRESVGGWLDGVVAGGPYSGGLERAVLRLKAAPDRRLTRVLARLLAERLDEAGLVGSGAVWTALVPVPLHVERQRERGFNQAALLTDALEELLGVPVWPRACERVRATPLQSGLGREERARNVLGAFRVTARGREDLLRCAVQAGRTGAGVRLMAVDDVLTTGATLGEVARVLKAAGAGAVWGAVVARALPPSTVTTRR